MILTYTEFLERTGIVLEVQEFERFLNDSRFEIERYTFGVYYRRWETYPLWIQVKVKEALIDLIKIYNEKPTEDKKIVSESVGSHSVTYKLEEETEVSVRVKDVIYKHLFNTGLLYRGLRYGK